MILMLIPFSSVSARLDHFAECLNQQDQIVTDNSVKIQSLICSFDQFRLNSESQLSSLEDQIKVLNEVPSVGRSPVCPPVPVEVLEVEQEEVVEGLRGKVKGLE